MLLGVEQVALFGVVVVALLDAQLLDQVVHIHLYTVSIAYLTVILIGVDVAVLYDTLSGIHI